jgi:hypothetical protein
VTKAARSAGWHIVTREFRENLDELFSAAAPGIVDPGEIRGTAEYGTDYSAREAKKHGTAAILKKDGI